MIVKGFFSEISAANNTLKELEQAGFKGAFVDINDHYIEDRNVRRNVAGTRSSTSLSDLVLHSSSGSADEGSSPLAASDPMVSGMGTFDEITNINYVVSVDTDSENVDKAKEILANMGADLDDPNINTHKLIVTSDFDLEKAISDIDDNL